MLCESCRGMAKNRQYIGSRYVEIFESNPMEMNVKIGSEKPGMDLESEVLRLRGLPWECTEEDIVQFFDGN